MPNKFIEPPEHREELGPLTLKIYHVSPNITLADVELDLGLFFSHGVGFSLDEHRKKEIKKKIKTRLLEIAEQI